MDVVAMPQLGETVTEGTITAWSVAVGDVVAVDDALFEVSTEKVDTEVPSAVAGHVRAILVPEGETVPVGAPVAVITATADEPVDLDALGGPAAPTEAPGEARPAADGSVPAAAPAPPAPDAVGAPASPAVATVAPAPAGARPAAPAEGLDGAPLSPVVRRLLAEHHLDPAAVVGSGRDGRVTRADVLAAAARRDTTPAAASAAVPAAPMAPAVPPPAEGLVMADDDEVIDFSRARLATAEHMVRSLATAAHALVVVEVDYTNVDAVRRAAGLSYLPFVARACTDAIREFPHVNASVDGPRLVVHPRVHLGVAVDVDQEALVVPVLRDAHDARLGAIAERVADLADRARRRRLTGDELSGATFTVTNVGSYGTVVTTPIINQPQVAIVSTDGVRMAPVAVPLGDPADRAWGIAVHPVGNLSLSFDHRAFDGAYAAAFLARVRTILQERDWSVELAP